MAYTPPSYNAVNFELGSGYSPPTYNDVDFELGDGSSTQTASHTATGGAVAGGSVDYSRTVAPPSSGGAVAGGSTDVTSSGPQIVTIQASGGAVAGGTAGTSTLSVQVVTATVSGGAISGGSAALAKTVAQSAAGGALAGGSASMAITSAVFVDGGAVAGGSADIVAVQPQDVAVVGEGGAVAGGMAIVDLDVVAVSVVLLAEGGAVAEGAAGRSITSCITSDGGAVAGGSAGFNFSYYQEPGNERKKTPAWSSTYVKSTASSTAPEYSDPVAPIDWENKTTEAPYDGWLTAVNNYNGAKINIDYGSSGAFVLKQLLLQNFHNQGGGTTVGFTSFKVYGSNSSTDFNNTTLNSAPASGTLLRDTTTLNQDGGYGDDQVFTISNTTSYQYYILMFSGTYGATQGGIRAAELFGPIATIEPDIDATLPALSIEAHTTIALVNPPAFSATYVKSTPDYGGGYGDQWRAVDPGSAVDGSASYAAWVCNTNQIVGAKINIDYGSTGAFRANQLRIWNFHNNGSETDKGVASIRLYGSNTQADFDNVTQNSVPASATLLLDTTAVARETSSSGTEQKFWFGNSTEFRYYVLFILSGHGHLNYTGIRRMLLYGTPGPVSSTVDCTLPAMRASFDAQEDGNVKILPAELTTTYVHPTGFPTEEYKKFEPINTLRQDMDGGSLIGDADYNCRLGIEDNTNFISFEASGRFFPDYVDIENYHDSGAETGIGLQNASVYGGNDANVFASVTTTNPALDTDAVTLLCQPSLTQHPATNTPDRQRFQISTSQSFRYYYITAGQNYGGGTGMGQGNLAGIRRWTVWGAEDTRLVADVAASMPSLSCIMTAVAPENATNHITATLKRMVAQFSDGPPPSIDIQLKPMTAFMVVDNMEGPPVGNIDITLPSLTAENPTPAWGVLDCSFPRLDFSAYALNTIDVGLPIMLCEMQGPPASVIANMVAALGMVDGEAVTGASVTIEHPAMTASLEASGTTSGSLSATMRILSCDMTAGADAPQDAVDVELAATMPRMSMSSIAIIGRKVDMLCSLRPLAFSSRGIPGVVGDAQLDLPAMRATGTGKPSWAFLETTLQALSMEADTARTCPTETLQYEEEAVQ